jgi:hypothetical protein
MKYLKIDGAFMRVGNTQEIWRSYTSCSCYTQHILEIYCVYLAAVYPLIIRIFISKDKDAI